MFKTTPLRRKLNEACQPETSSRWDISELIKLFKELNNFKSLEKEFEVNKVRAFNRFINHIQKFGLFPKDYKQAGNSPRLMPVKYDQTIHCCKKFLRKLVFQNIAKVLRDEDWVTLDLDLVSCYTCIICRLYPDKLHHIREAVQTVGLWKFLEREFEEKGMKDMYNKPCVKICFYSALFGGTVKAMLDGLIKQEAKDAGMSEQNFRNTFEFEGVHLVAKEVAACEEGMGLIKDLRDLFKHVRMMNLNSEMIGRTGHPFLVYDKENVKKAFPNSLQGYEFALVAQATLKTLEKFPSAELLYHFHDGNVIAVK